VNSENNPILAAKPNFWKKSWVDVSVLKNGSPQTDPSIAFNYEVEGSDQNGVNLQVNFGDVFALQTIDDDFYILQFIFKDSKETYGGICAEVCVDVDFTMGSEWSAVVPKGYVVHIPIPA
jgi:hypothetical protein